MFIDNKTKNFCLFVWSTKTPTCHFLETKTKYKHLLLAEAQMESAWGGLIALGADQQCQQKMFQQEEGKDNKAISDKPICQFPLIAISARIIVATLY